MPPFVIFALPRSRTAWLSRFLTYGDHVCGHEELRHMRSLDDIAAWFSQPNIGAVETAAAPYWRLLQRFAPDARAVVVRRPVEDVVDSLMRLEGLVLDRARLTAEMWKLDRKLDQIEARFPGAISVRFEDLVKQDVCAQVFEHCLGRPHASLHWAALHSTNIQIDMRAMMRYAEAYRKPLERLAAVAKHQTLAALATHEPIAADGITLQTEPFETWLRDATPLFNEHLIQVGEAPGDWQGKNIPLMRLLYDAGAMQIMTARCNGRMFGYLVTLISPSLTSESVTSAAHNTFFASPEFPGLGLKLHRAALRSLKERGVDDVFMQARTRGVGERISAIYRRLGAENDGQVFRLELAGA